MQLQNPAFDPDFAAGIGRRPACWYGDGDIGGEGRRSSGSKGGVGGVGYFFGSNVGDIGGGGGVGSGIGNGHEVGYGCGYVSYCEGVGGGGAGGGGGDGILGREGGGGGAVVSAGFGGSGDRPPRSLPAAPFNAAAANAARAAVEPESVAQLVPLSRVAQRFSVSGAGNAGGSGGEVGWAWEAASGPGGPGPEDALRGDSWRE